MSDGCVRIAVPMALLALSQPAIADGGGAIFLLIFPLAPLVWMVPVYLVARWATGPKPSRAWAMLGAVLGILAATWVYCSLVPPYWYSADFITTLELIWRLLEVMASTLGGWFAFGFSFVLASAFGFIVRRAVSVPR